MDWEFEPKIAELRASKGLTQLELAQRVGVTETTIANWERGRSGVEWLDRLIRLCATLECGPEDLLSYIPKFPSKNSKEELVRLLEDKQKDRSEEQEEASEIDVDDFEAITEEGGKFSEIMSLMRAGQKSKADSFTFSAPPVPTKDSIVSHAGKRSRAK